jgi:hypothetical protein
MNWNLVLANGERRMKVLVNSLVALTLVVAPAAAEKQTIKKLKACGSEATNSFGYHKEYPATNEGNGYVGFQTEEADATGTKERYSLVNCATRQIVRIEVEYLLKESAKAGSFNGDLFTQIAALRKKSRLANESLLSEWANSQGFKPSVGNLPAQGSQSTARSDCGCQVYYPDL